LSLERYSSYETLKIPYSRPISTSPDKEKPLPKNHSALLPIEGPKPKYLDLSFTWSVFTESEPHVY